MKTNTSTKQLENTINSLCVKTYLNVLGHPCFVASKSGKAFFKCPFSASGPLIVDPTTNTFRSGDGKVTGGLLELASALFNQPKEAILRNLRLYRIDILMDICGDTCTPIWDAA